MSGAAAYRFHPGLASFQRGWDRLKIAGVCRDHATGAGPPKNKRTIAGKTIATECLIRSRPPAASLESNDLSREIFHKLFLR